ncbi:hypothetical protein [Winogradskyella sediminis]|uniref:hypothetical protein n=1 Tax=Winogradskyella sediminis TaxID=1382466 RepID=UPI000E3A8B82|nr:hypothetical protein [Winogradskyella sediminis]REG84095.1 hypothetical protein C8N41_10817 [Winogradskyella sediminis]
MMKFKISIVFILLFSINLFAQEVTLESKELTSEQKRKQKISEEIKKIKVDYNKSWMQFETTFNKLSPLNVVLYPTREKLDKKIQDIEQALYEIQRLGLKQKCQQLTRLENSIGQTGDYCSNVEGRIKRLSERQKEVVNEIADLQKKDTDKSKDKQPTLIVNKNARDDFWNGVSDDSKETKSNNDDFWNGKSEKVRDTNSDDEFWNGKTKAKQPSKSYTNQTSISKNELEIIDGEENLRRKGSSDLIFPKNKFIGFRKFGEFFVAKMKIETKNLQWEDIKLYNQTYLFDKNGNVLLESFRHCYFDESKTEIHSETYESIVYSHSVDGGYFSDTLFYKVVYKLEIYDLEMNLKSVENNTREVEQNQLY